MQQKRILHLALWFMVLSVLGTAQGAAPDFSGHWILESRPTSAGDVALTLSISQTLVRTTARGQSMTPFFKDVSVVREFATGSRTETYPIDVVGGSVSGTAGGRAVGPMSHQRVMWDSATLVIENDSHAGPSPETGEWTERREAWSLDPSGRLRVTITERASGGSPAEITLLYRRAGGRRV